MSAGMKKSEIFSRQNKWFIFNFIRHVEWMSASNALCLYLARLCTVHTLDLWYTFKLRLTTKQNLFNLKMFVIF